jgi:small subunit ribosomal protein S16
MNYLLLSTIHEDNRYHFGNFIYLLLYSLNLVLLKKKIIYILSISSMLKLRLKRTGKKRFPSYRLVVMENTARRDGRPIEEVGYYNPITKQSKFEVEKIQKWLNYGVQPTQTVLALLKKAEITK